MLFRSLSILEMCRRTGLRPTLPSWSSTATPSAVSHTSLSSAVAPICKASVNASIVLAGAWACPPRWANAMGGLRSDSTIHPSSPVRRPPAEKRLKRRDQRSRSIDPVIVVWVLLGAVVIVAGYFLLKVVKQLNRTMVALVNSMGALGEVAAELQKLKGGSSGEVKEHNGSVDRSEEHTSELQSRIRISYAVFCLKKKM